MHGGMELSAIRSQRFKSHCNCNCEASSLRSLTRGAAKEVPANT